MTDVEPPDLPGSFFPTSQKAPPGNPKNHTGMPVTTRALVEPIVMLAASTVVAILAARGQFTSVMGFPWVFGGLVLLFGARSLLKQRSFSPIPRIVMVVLAGAGRRHHGA